MVALTSDYAAGLLSIPGQVASGAISTQSGGLGTAASSVFDMPGLDYAGTSGLSTPYDRWAAPPGEGGWGLLTEADYPAPRDPGLFDLDFDYSVPTNPALLTTQTIGAPDPNYPWPDASAFGGDRYTPEQDTGSLLGDWWDTGAQAMPPGGFGLVPAGWDWDAGG